MKLPMRCCLLCLCLILLPGCVFSRTKVKHNMTPPGATGFVTEQVEIPSALLPDKNGELLEGKAVLNPGTMIYIPKTKEEVVQRLKDAGVKFAEPAK